MSASAREDLRWQADPQLAPALEALGWPEPEAVERAFANLASTGRSATALLALPDRSERIHLRRVQHGGWLGPLWRGTILGPKRSLSEWEANQRLHQSGAPVPRPALVAAWRRLGPFWTAVYGTVHIEEARDGVAWLAQRPERSELLDGARRIGAAIRGFHDCGGRHADLHLKNLLVRVRGGEFESWVIDLDGAQAGEPPTPARRMRELMRLARSLVKRGVVEQVGRRGIAATFQGYCAGDRLLRRAMLGSLERERRRNALHALFYLRSGA